MELLNLINILVTGIQEMSASMLYMFNAATNFNNGEAPGASNNTMNWNTQNVQNVAYMFYGAKAFNQKLVLGILTMLAV